MPGAGKWRCFCNGCFAEAQVAAAGGLGLFLIGCVFRDGVYPGKGKAPWNGRRGRRLVQLTARGKAAQGILLQMEEYKTVKVEKTAIMPNHIHLLLFVREGECAGSSQAPNPTNAAVPLFVSLFKRKCNRICGENIWQRSYHDHIVRDEADYQRIWEYIDTNPAKWREDCFYSE